MRVFRAAGEGAGRAAGRPARGACVALPCGFERDALLAELRLHFVRLQEAWDLGAMPALQGLTTPEMLAEFCLELPGCIGDVAGRTDVVTLQADLFAFEELGGTFVVSVEFSGLMRHAPGEVAAPFRELWMLMRSKDGASGWKLARHQALL
jgi:predicted lipid-binding transport protein (Tim44 family)